MTNVSSDELRSIAESLFVPTVITDLGFEWSERFQQLLSCVQQTLRAVSTERLPKGVTIGYLPKSDQRLLVGPCARFIRCSQLTTYHDGAKPLTIQLLETGEILVWQDELGAEPVVESFLLYRYRGPRDEVIVTPQREHPVPKLDAAHSFFAVPYFLELHDAIVDYGQNVARKSTCPTLKGVWREPSRYVFRRKPEADMRRSLQTFLRYTLRNHHDVSVMPEQNVSETRPVDIKVTWASDRRVALIEIKWLGVSADVGDKRFTSTHKADRAQQGAEQLVEYLDLYDREATGEETRGYLVVFDGRRHNLYNPSITSLSREDAFFYQHDEIEYPVEILSRDDFAAPIRMFCEPEVI